MFISGLHSLILLPEELNLYRLGGKQLWRTPITYA
jgi:hypothetical protein